MTDLDCRSCGACCVGDYDDGYGYAHCSSKDVARMSPGVRRRLSVVSNGHAGEERTDTPGVYTEAYGKSCGFLRGTPGKRVSCRIYETKPDVCSKFKPGSKACREARLRFGL